MREIKFRLWNDYDKKMLNWSYLLERNLANIFTLPSYKKWLMQYTGLKDKNGKEIYEGDIVELKAKSGCCNMLGKIIYDNYDLAFELIDEEGNQEALWYAEQELEVIGNVWEDSDLLNDSKNTKSN